LRVTITDDDSVLSGTINEVSTDFLLTITKSEDVLEELTFEDIFAMSGTPATDGESPEMQIVEFSAKGLIYIDFTHTMLVPKNVTQINENVLSLSFIHSYSVLQEETEI